MFTAINKITGLKIIADYANKEEEEFICPECKCDLMLKRGLVKDAHFAHLKYSTCIYSHESELHLKIKKDIYSHLNASISKNVKGIELEKYLGSVRPDIFVTGFKKSIAIEIQISELTVEQILYRTTEYFKKGVYVLWILPYDNYRFYVNERLDWDTVKLKEWERIILYMGFKTIAFWDINHEFCTKFIVLKFEDVFTNDVEFYDVNDHESKYYSSRKLKTKKKIYRKRFIELKDFIPTYVKSFHMPMSKYVLPERKVLIYRWDN